MEYLSVQQVFGRFLFLRCFRGGRFQRRRLLRDYVADFAGLNLVLSNTAGFTRGGLYQCAGSSLELAGAAGGNEDIAIFAVELFRRFHFQIYLRGWVLAAMA